MSGRALLRRLESVDKVVVLSMLISGLTGNRPQPD